MPKQSALVQMFERFEDREGRDWRHGDITIDELKALLNSSALHHVSVSADVFGLVEIPLSQVWYRLNDEYFIKQLDRIAEKHGQPCVCHVTIGEAHVRRRRTYDPLEGTRDYSMSRRPTKYKLSIHWFGVRKDEMIYHAT